MICSWSACILIYLLTVAVTGGIGLQFFENNILLREFLEFLALGIFSCMAFGSIFCMVTMLLGNKTLSVMVCMGLSFFMLFLCLHTNQIVVQQTYTNGVPNPHYVDVIKRMIYELLHDLNPFGQIAQLSSMKYYNSIRWIGLDIFWIFSAGLGSALFCKKDIK